MKNKRNIAIIFFSRNSPVEARHKLWFKEKSKNQNTASLLINKAKRVINEAGLPVYHFHENNQKGNYFGERLTNAYQEVFDLGYEQVISVGNDCPDLENINWTEISLCLSQGKSVLGPDRRGGAYLIGLQKKHFDPSKFKKLNWQTNTLYKELSYFCNNSSMVIELNHYRDINSIHDLRILSKAKRAIDTFRQLLFQLLKAFKELIPELKLSLSIFFLFKDSPLRAPPIQ